MPENAPEMRVFVVNVHRPDGSALPTLHANRVEAAYYKTDGGFTTFKNSQHQDVYTVRNDCLVTVERADAPVDDRAARFLELLEAADRDGRAEGSIEQEETLPDGRVLRSGYHVAISVQESIESPV